MEVVNNLNQMFSSGLDYVNSNKLVSSVLGLFLVLYAALAAPKLPKSVTMWFDNTWFKLGFMFLIAFMATKDPSVAIISAVALLVTLQTLSAQKTTENVVQAVQAKVEKFSELKNLKEKIVMTKSENRNNHNANSELLHPAYNLPHQEDGLPHQEVGFSHEEDGYPLHESNTPSTPSSPRSSQQEASVVHSDVAVSKAPPVCNTNADDMTGYESGELATF